MKASGAWQAVKWNMRRNAKRHEDSSQTFVESNPHGNRYGDVVSMEMC